MKYFLFKKSQKFEHNRIVMNDFVCGESKTSMIRFYLCNWSRKDSHLCVRNVRFLSKESNSQESLVDLLQHDFIEIVNWGKLQFVSE